MLWKSLSSNTNQHSNYKEKILQSRADDMGVSVEFLSTIIDMFKKKKTTQATSHVLTFQNKVLQNIYNNIEMNDDLGAGFNCLSFTHNSEDFWQPNYAEHISDNKINKQDVCNRFDSYLKSQPKCLFFSKPKFDTITKSYSKILNTLTDEYDNVDQFIKSLNSNINNSYGKLSGLSIQNNTIIYTKHNLPQLEYIQSYQPNYMDHSTLSSFVMIEDDIELYSSFRFSSGLFNIHRNIGLDETSLINMLKYIFESSLVINVGLHHIYRNISNALIDNVNYIGSKYKEEVLDTYDGIERILGVTHEVCEENNKEGPPKLTNELKHIFQELNISTSGLGV